MEDIKSLRKKIYGIDEELMQLLSERFRLTKMVESYNEINGLKMSEEERTQKVMSHLRPQEPKLNLADDIWNVIFNYTRCKE